MRIVREAFTHTLAFVAGWSLAGLTRNLLGDSVQAFIASLMLCMAVGAVISYLLLGPEDDSRRS